MEFKQKRATIISIGLIGILLLASPTIALFIKMPASQHFSDLYILGSNHTFDGIPFNIIAGQTYSLYLGVGNHMGSSEYYTCVVKMGNESASPPNSTLKTVSPLPALYDYKTFVTDGATYEAPLTFQVDQITFNDSMSQLSSIAINGIEYSTNLYSAWNSNRTGYYYNLFVELSTYNSTLSTTQYNDRYVRLILNMTQ
jgi:hypothetical protein